MIQELLLHHTNAIPFLCLQANEKRTMLVIGPGGGKEILMGLFGDVEKITGVEVNSDFVNIVKDYKEFDGGIYSDFSNVKIVVEEGRHYVKQSKEQFDLIVMALPSTEQMQNIELFAMSENYLLTREALQDYFNILMPEGRMIFTVHNRWELLRLMTTTTSVLNKMGIVGNDMQNHFAVLEAEYAPTIVIKKNAFTKEESLRWKNTCATLPQDFPQVSYLPYGMKGSNQSTAHNFLTTICQSDESMQAYIARDEYDISPCRDDKPYFYNMHKGAPQIYLWLLAGIAGFNFLVLVLPLKFIKKTKHDAARTFGLPLIIFGCIGTGCMVLEISLFQKLVLYLGSPTISLSILLSSLLVGMGTGSYFGKNVFRTDMQKRLLLASISTVLAGILLFIASPTILSKCLEYGTVLRSTICFLMILPLAFFMGIPFPTCIQLLYLDNQENYIPWMYGINGSMSVLGSVLAIVVSMVWGFTPTYFIGLSFYLSIFIFLYVSSKRKIFQR
jgi:spermidine synthase